MHSFSNRILFEITPPSSVLNSQTMFMSLKVMLGLIVFATVTLISTGSEKENKIIRWYQIREELLNSK